MSAAALGEQTTRPSAQNLRGSIRLVSGPKQRITSRQFSAPDIDIRRIDNLYNSEAFVRRAIDKHIELMFKAGWDLIGDDTASVDYIKKRLYLIAEMTCIPVNQLFVEIAEDLVKYSNAVVVKVRKDIQWPRGIRVRGVNGMKPVVGYFPVNLNYVEVSRDTAGNVDRWRLNFPSSSYGSSGTSKPLELRPEDVIHFYYKREKNQVFAVPYLVSVIEDINALRQAEENVLKLIYRNLYPFLHHKIGSEKEGYGGTDEEVEAARALIENMDLEAGLVTTERHNIDTVALDQVIDALGYLRYFEQRVFTGLGVSEVVMGRAGSASRATAESQYFDLRETVKAMQRVMESFVNEFIIKELLMEGGYDPFFKPQSAVYFRFREIDLDMKIKYENHIIYQYLANCITEDEMRAELSRDPISDRSKLFYNLVTIPVEQATGRSGGTSDGVSSDDVINRNQPQNTPKPSRGLARKGGSETLGSVAELALEIYKRAYETCCSDDSGTDPLDLAVETNQLLLERITQGEDLDIDAMMTEARKKWALEKEDGDVVCPQ